MALFCQGKEDDSQPGVEPPHPRHHAGHDDLLLGRVPHLIDCLQEEAIVARLEMSQSAEEQLPTLAMQKGSPLIENAVMALVPLTFPSK